MKEAAELTVKRPTAADDTAVDMPKNRTLSEPVNHHQRERDLSMTGQTQTTTQLDADKTDAQRFV